ncbi:hypothetical protein DL770_009772 [Monosporascus sp. CRB-9-2]|nr:hypothetical protein DL770_009772 [Monosporascus sp. CRB-9-2]
MEGDVIALSPLDNVMAHCYAKYLLPFAFNPNRGIKEVYEVLRESLSMTVAEMPIYSGKVHYRPPERPEWKPGQLEVRIPKRDWLDNTYPLILHDLSDEMEFDDLKDTGFPEEDLDGMLLLPEAFKLDLDRGLDVAVVQANFVRNGCLLGLGIWHSVSDAYGAFNFISLWASNAKKLQTESELERPVSIRASTIAKNNDRDVLTRIWRNEGGERLQNMQSTSANVQRLWRYLGLHHPSTVTRESAPDAKLSKPAVEQQRMRTCMFYVSARSFHQLNVDNGLSEADKKAPSITTNDVLNGLIWRCVMKARFPGDNTGERDMDSNYQIAVDGRMHLSASLESSYLGNVIFFATSTLPLSVVTAPSATLTSLALALRTSLDSYTVSDMRQSFGIAQDIADYSTLTYTFAGLSGATMNVSTTLQAPIFTLDFGPAFGVGGTGNLECIRVFKDELDQAFRRVLVMPMMKDGGFEILVALFEDEMNRLLADEEWAKYVQFTSY